MQRQRQILAVYQRELDLLQESKNHNLLSPLSSFIHSDTNIRLFAFYYIIFR